VAKNQYRKPLSEALDQYVQNKVIPFHTPGHKQGRSLDHSFGQLIGKELLQRDLTEVVGLDNLHQPEGVIEEAQVLAAVLAGAQKSWFVVGGKIAAYYAALSAFLKPGDYFLMDRYTGEDGWKAAVLGNFRPILLPAISMQRGGIFSGIQTASLEEGFRSYPGIKAVLLSGMTETGIGNDLAAASRICSDWNTGLIVDDSHNSTALGSDKTIPSALATGADLVVYADFRLPISPAQGVMLFQGTNRVSSSRVQTALQTIQSTSPSYLLMAALDVLRYDLWRCGSPRTMDQRQILDYLKERCRQHTDFKGNFVEELLPDGYRMDPLRVTVCFPGIVESKTLQGQCRYGLNYAVYVPEMGTVRIDPELIMAEFLAASVLEYSSDASADEISLGFYICKQGELWYQPKSLVSLENAVGRRLARPFQIPGSDGGWLFPGESISADIVSIVSQNRDYSHIEVEIIQEV
jgi:arginine decarboxylase